MRQGKLLAESSPQNLLDYFKIDSLENVFLKLCVDEEKPQPQLPQKENKFVS